MKSFNVRCVVAAMAPLAALPTAFVTGQLHAQGSCDFDKDQILMPDSGSKLEERLTRFKERWPGDKKIPQGVKVEFYIVDCKAEKPVDIRLRPAPLSTIVLVPVGLLRQSE